MNAGYSRETVATNMKALREEGKSVQEAALLALSAARVSYFKRFPNGALPRWLAYPKTHLLKHHYDANGRALHSGAGALALRENPSLRSEILQGEELQRAFSGHRTKNIVRLPAQGGARVKVAIGKVLGIIYETRRDGRSENYIHRFAKASRPLLTASADGKRLELLGGAFNFTERGIVDRKPRRGAR